MYMYIYIYIYMAFAGGALEQGQTHQRRHHLYSRSLLPLSWNLAAKKQKVKQVVCWCTCRSCSNVFCAY